MAYDIDMAPRRRPYVPTYSGSPERDAARHDDFLDQCDQEQQDHEAAVAREEARLEALALSEAAAGDYDRIWRGVDHADNDREVMVALLACARGEPGAQAAAQMVVSLLAKTYATHNAEVA